jgi:hypothetical protein
VLVDGLVQSLLDETLSVQSHEESLSLNNLLWGNDNTQVIVDWRVRQIDLLLVIMLRLV